LRWLFARVQVDAMMIRTRFLLLRKASYSESSLIVSGISPDHGLLQFFVGGAKRLGRKRFPAVDVFRVLEVQYTPARTELHRWRSVDTVADYGRLAGAVELFDAAVWLAALALGNVPTNVAHERFFHATTLVLERLATLAADSAPVHVAETAVGAVTAAAVVLLDESGLLPDYRGDPQRAKQRQILLDAAAGREELPRLSLHNWMALHRWTIELLRESEYYVPSQTLRTG